MMLDFHTATAAEAVGKQFRPEWGGWVQVVAIGGRDVHVAVLSARPGREGWALESETISRECAALRVRDGLWALVATEVTT